MPPHTLSVATAHAIHRMLDDPEPDVVVEACAFAQQARERLCLNNTNMTATMMFAQPLVKLWQPHWRFAYVVGLILGTKYTTDGFFIVDIIEHLTDEFPLEALKEGESVALEIFEWKGIHGRQRSFRNALVNVALENPMPATQNGAAAVDHLHVVIVDDCPVIREIHDSMVKSIHPRAKTALCRNAVEAINYVRGSDERGDHVTLILLDLNLTLPEGEASGGEAPPSIETLINEQGNGLDVPTALDEPVFEVPNDFRFKPFIAILSSHVEALRIYTTADGSMNNDGSARGCDALVPKPCTLETMQVLIDGSAV